MNPSQAGTLSAALRYVRNLNRRLSGAPLLLLIAFAPFLVGGCAGDHWVRVLDFALLYAMLGLGLNVVVGYAGLLDLGYIAFYAVGAYLGALLSSPQLTSQFAWIAALAPHGLHVSVWLIAPLAMALAAFFGILLGAPTLRLRGDYLAIVTLGFGEIVRILINNLDRPVNITNGPQGINGIDPVSLFGFNFARKHDLFGVGVPAVYQYYYVFLLCVLFVVFVCTRMQYSRIGRAWAAVREDELAAKAMGIKTRDIKLLVFVVGASFGGLAGAMFGAFQGFVSPESFTFMESLLVLACVVLGGMGHIPGVILGALILAVFPEFLRATVVPLQHMVLGHAYLRPEVARQLLYAIGMIAIMRFRPEGLWPAKPLMAIKQQDRMQNVVANLEEGSAIELFGARRIDDDELDRRARMFERRVAEQDGAAEADADFDGGKIDAGGDTEPGGEPGVAESTES